MIPLTLNSSQNEIMPNLQDVIKERLDDLDIVPNEYLGQHFLVDEIVLSQIANMATGSNVIEVGAGVGQLTEKLAETADSVVSIEIDRRFEPILERIQLGHTNLEVIYGNALKELPIIMKDLEKQRDLELQLIANLPYHITEPFMQMMARYKVDMVLLVGERFARAALNNNTDSLLYTKNSFLINTFYEVRSLAEVPRKSFYPEPRTKSRVIELIYKDAKQLSVFDYLARSLFLTAKKSPLVKNVLKNALTKYENIGGGLLSKKEANRKTRRSNRQRLAGIYRRNVGVVTETGFTQNMARGRINRIGIPKSILEKPFSQLNNDEIRMLSSKLQLMN